MDYGDILTGGSALGISDSDYAAASTSSATNNIGLGSALNGAAAGIGLAASIYGTEQQMKGAQASNAATVAQIGDEQQINAVKNQAANMQFQRQDMQQLRNNQRLRSQALATASGQGQGTQTGMMGSGLSGSYGAIGGQIGNNLLSNNQNQEVTNQIYGLNQQISTQEIAKANAQLQSQTGAGIASLGSSISKAVGPLGNLAASALPLLLL